MDETSQPASSSSSICDITEKFQELNLTNLQDLEKVERKRNDLEINTVSWGRTLEWYRNYIEAEKDILERIQIARRYATTPEEINKNESYQLKFKKRICRFLSNGMHYFPHDYDFHLQYFEYCKDNIIAAAEAAEQLLNQFWHKPEAWKDVIRYHAYDRKDKKLASVLMNYALHTKHKHSPILLKEAIELELTDFGEESGGKCFKRRKPLSSEEKVKELVEIILRKVNDFHLWIEILDMIGNRDTKKVQKLMISRMKIVYTTEADIWNAIAQKYFKDFLDKPDLTEPRTSKKSKLEICFETYQKGMLKVDKKTDLLLYYLDALIECRRCYPNRLQQQILLNTLKDISDQSILTEKHYIVWIDSLIDEYQTELDPVKKEQISNLTFSVIETAFANAPHSISISIMQLRAAIVLTDEAVTEQIFEKTIERLKKQSVLLWVFKLSAIVPSDYKAEAFFRKAIKGQDDVSEFFRCRYLDWLSMYKDITEVRRKYHEIAEMKPYSRELHSIMVRVEFFQDPPNPEEWEKVAINIVEQFGSIDVGVWVYYGDFLNRFRKEGIEEMREKARSRLSPEAFENFQSRFRASQEMELNLKESKIMGFISLIDQEVRRIFREEREALHRQDQAMSMEQTGDQTS